MLWSLAQHLAVKSRTAQAMLAVQVDKINASTPHFHGARASLATDRGSRMRTATKAHATTNTNMMFDIIPYSAAHLPRIWYNVEMKLATIATMMKRIPEIVVIDLGQR